jgi:hypothetical protein
MIRWFHPLRRVRRASSASSASTNDLLQRIQKLEEKVVEYEDRLDILSMVGSGLVITTSLLVLCKEPKQTRIM